MERGLTKNEILTQLSKSPHGKLTEYVDVAAKAVRQEPEFMAHLLSWNAEKGQIRDSKVALPVISLDYPEMHPEFQENAIAHVISLDPRNMVRALRFGKEIKAHGSFQLHGAVKKYLAALEEDWGNWSGLPSSTGDLWLGCICSTTATDGTRRRIRECVKFCSRKSTRRAASSTPSRN